MRATDRIYLTGMMGSGKSTLGPKLARELERSFLDLDTMVESNAQRKIKEIFSSQGEDEFRRFESAALKKASIMQNVVIALGGGALISDENQELVLRSGILVYLSLSEESLFRRLTEERSSRRPLLENKGSAEGAWASLKNNTRILLAQRMEGYSRADLKVDVDGCSVDEALNRIVLALGSIGVFGQHDD